MSLGSVCTGIGTMTQTALTLVLWIALTWCQNAVALPSHDCESVREDVERWLRDEGASPDYYWLMVAESRCRDGAVSDKGAVGYWQMMPYTMHHYGCFDADDLECQTRAAARYLLHLERLVGKKNVVMGWNMGGHNFLRRGATAQARGLDWLFRKYVKRERTK